MKIEIIEATVANGKDVFPGQEIELNDREASNLIRLHKARRPGGRESAGSGPMTMADLKKLNKGELIEKVNSEFDLNVGDEMKVAEILDLAEDAIEERGE
jgi:hypothetical protein